MFIHLTTLSGKGFGVKVSEIKKVYSCTDRTGSVLRLEDSRDANVTQSPSEVLALIRKEEKRQCE